MSNARPGTGLQLFDVAADFAKAMGYRDADKATRLLDEDEKGTQIVGTPGGPQQMNVIYEDGLWELIFRSTLPGAKAIKKRVKEILRQVSSQPEDYDAWCKVASEIAAGGA